MSDTPNPVVEAAPAPAPTALVKQQTPHTGHYNPNEPSALYLNTPMFEQAMRSAVMLSRSGTIPKHLQDNPSDCFLVIEQATRWGMSPFAVAQSCYVLSGKLGYEGKLVAAVVNASPNLKAKLNYEYSGSGAQRQVRVFGTLKGEEKPREIIGTVAAWQTTNTQWSTQTDQMLSYRGAREWARRHMPETLLGVYADDELPEVVGQATVVVSTPSLDDFGSVVSASDDPKSQPIDAEVVEKPKKKAKEKPEPPPVVDAEEAELDKLFSR
jgi:hypothetical protein